MDFKSELKARTEIINEKLTAMLPTEQGRMALCTEAMNYSFTAGGKRLRPVILAEVFRMFGGEGDIAEPFMAALEMIHTYSLVHDDLPSMDNDTLRRGKPTTWVTYGEGMAVLAGDALLNYAYETAAAAFDMAAGAEEMKRVAKALQILAKKAGIYGMVGGQTADVESEKQGIPIDADRLIFIPRLKTGALLESAFMVGAVLAGAADDEIEKMSEAALCTGVAFQIRDDILDVEGDEALLGKNVGSDEESGKETYVTLYGMDRAKSDVEMYSARAVELVDSLGRDSEFLTALIRSLVGRAY